MFLNLLGNIFASWEANFVSATMFPEVGKRGNIDRKHVFAQMFPSLSRAFQVTKTNLQKWVGSSKAVKLTLSYCKFQWKFLSSMFIISLGISSEILPGPKRFEID